MKTQQTTIKTLDAMATDFGAFYPAGHMVVGFRSDSDLQEVRLDLEAQGFDRTQWLEVSAAEMTEFAQRNLKDAGFLASWGTSMATVQHFLDAAKQGTVFLILPLPDTESADQVTNAIHRVPYVLAERYHALAIESVA